MIADQHWKTVQEDDKQNEELLELSRQTLALTKEVRSLADPGTRPEPVAGLGSIRQLSYPRRPAGSRPDGDTPG